MPGGSAPRAGPHRRPSQSEHAWLVGQSSPTWSIGTAELDSPDDVVLGCAVDTLIYLRGVKSADLLP